MQLETHVTDADRAEAEMDQRRAGPRKYIVPQGVGSALLALASIIRERDDAELRRLCAFYLKPTIDPAIARLQDVARGAIPNEAASFADVIAAWRALARLTGVSEERRCGQPTCRLKPKRMQLCRSCQAIMCASPAVSDPRSPAQTARRLAQSSTGASTACSVAPSTTSVSQWPPTTTARSISTSPAVRPSLSCRSFDSRSVYTTRVQI